MDSLENNRVMANDIPETWPEPMEPMPDKETPIDWVTQNGGCEATDGCWAEGDSYCPHWASILATCIGYDLDIGWRTHR